MGYDISDGMQHMQNLEHSRVVTDLITINPALHRSLQNRRENSCNTSVFKNKIKQQKLHFIDMTYLVDK